MNASPEASGLFWCRHLLSLMDRDPDSPTAGCVDRKYWAWRARDFADATLQYAAVPLLKAAAAPGTGLGEDERRHFFEAAQLAAHFLLRIQHRNGSLDQCYPHERHPGVVLDVLPLWLRLLGDHGPDLEPGLRSGLERGVERGLGFVLRTREDYALISNHLAHFAWVLLEADRLLGRPGCRSLADEYLERLLAGQSSEGWHAEYGGPDPGYQTRTLSYLARVLELRPDATLRDSAQRAAEFLLPFAYPDGTFGNEMGSRGTSLVYPYGLAALSGQSPAASALLRFRERSREEGRGVELHHLDLDNLIRVLDDEMDASEARRTVAPVPPVDLPWEREDWAADYPQAGISVRRRHWYYALAHLRKGGLLKVYNVAERRAVHADTGWVCRRDGEAWSNHLLQDSAAVRQEPDLAAVECRFHRPLHAVLTPARMVVLRLCNLTLWRVQALADLARRVLVRLLFSGRRPGDMVFRRTIAWGPEITVETTVDWPGGGKRSFRATTRFNPAPMASAKYYQVAEAGLVERDGEFVLESGQPVAERIGPRGPSAGTGEE